MNGDLSQFKPITPGQRGCDGKRWFSSDLITLAGIIATRVEVEHQPWCFDVLAGVDQDVREGARAVEVLRQIAGQLADVGGVIAPV